MRQTDRVIALPDHEFAFQGQIPVTTFSRPEATAGSADAEYPSHRSTPLTSGSSRNPRLGTRATKPHAVSKVHPMLACAVASALLAMASPPAQAAEPEVEALKVELAAQRKLIEELLAKQEQASSVRAAVGAAPTPVSAGPAPSVGPTVKWYGVLDVGLTNTDSGYGRKTRVEGAGGLSASRLGFQVKQVFGNGLVATAVAEGGVQYTNGTIGAGAQASGINAGTASSAGLPGTGVQLFARTMYGALDGDFGSLSIGRQYTGSYIGAAAIGVAQGDGLLGNSATIVPLVGGMPTRVNNSLIWKTPKYQGLYGWVTYFGGVQNNVDGPTVSGATTTTDKAGRGFDLAGMYSNGPLNATVSAWQLYNNSWVTAGETDLATKKGFLLAANYDFGIAKIFGEVAQGKISGGNYENVTKVLSDSVAYALGVTVPFGKHTFKVSYTDLNDKSSLNRDAKMIGVGWWYTIEPNLRVYAGAGKLMNSANASYSLSDGGNLVGSLPKAGVNPNGVQVGMNYSF